MNQFRVVIKGNAKEAIAAAKDYGLKLTNVQGHDKYPECRANVDTDQTTLMGWFGKTFHSVVDDVVNKPGTLLHFSELS